MISAVFPGVDASAAAFEFMTWRDTELDGVGVRLARISFSGELAFEVNVDARYGLAVWERLIAAGEPYGITPTAPRRCTSCAPRRATRSSGRTPTAPSPHTTWG